MQFLQRKLAIINNKQKSKMAYLKDLVITLIIMLSNKLKNIKYTIIKTSGNLKPITFTSLVSIKSIKSVV